MGKGGRRDLFCGSLAHVSTRQRQRTSKRYPKRKVIAVHSSGFFAIKSEVKGRRSEREYKNTFHAVVNLCRHVKEKAAFLRLFPDRKDFPITHYTVATGKRSSKSFKWDLLLFSGSLAEVGAP